MPETKSNGEPLGRGGEPEGKQPARPKEKPYAISKEAVWKAYQEVKANDGAAGVDDESIAAFEADLKDNLYKVWNRMSSGSYFPPPVRVAEIAKRDGGKRTLGIPTVADRVAQGVVKAYLEPLVEPIFLPDSYGYRPGKSALDAVKVARERCWDYDWVVDLDVKAFFDNLDHELMLKAVQHHQPPAWVVLYVTRWLTAPAQHADGRLEARTKGTPQGGVASPLLANLFLHYAFDVWITKEFPDVRFERYADDIIIHVATRARAEEVLDAVRRRLAECKLELHPEKTKIVYCKDGRRRDEHEQLQFDFLSYTFRPRSAFSRGKAFTGFLPAISRAAAEKIRRQVRAERIPRWWSNRPLEEVAAWLNVRVRGWANYYGKYYPSELTRVFRRFNDVLLRWARRKYRVLRTSLHKALAWLCRLYKREPTLFVHWQKGAHPTGA